MLKQLKEKLDSEKVVSVRFTYHGVRREVDNVTLQSDDTILCGFEMRKVGQFSYHIKKFRINEIEGDIEFIDPPKREGPVIGR